MGVKSVTVIECAGEADAVGIDAVGGAVLDVEGEGFHPGKSVAHGVEAPLVIEPVGGAGAGPVDCVRDLAQQPVRKGVNDNVIFLP